MGRMDEDHRSLLSLQLARLKALDRHMAQLDARIDQRLEPYREKHVLLMQIPGVDRILAATLIAELGVDVTVFHGPRAVAAWAGVCPGNNESAGRRRGAKARRGNGHLTTALVAAYHMLSTGLDCKDLGAAYLDHLDKTKVTSQLVRRLNRLAYQVTLTENGTAA